MGAMVKLNSNFLMVRCADKTTSDKVKSNAISTMIFFDGDGKEYLRSVVEGDDSVQAAFKKALEVYSKKPISWASGEPSTVMSQTRDDKKKLVALAFLDDKKDSEALVNSLEDRWLAKHQDRLVFTTVAFDRAWVQAVRGNSEEAHQWLRAAEGGTPDAEMPDGCLSARPWMAVVRAAMCSHGLQWSNEPPWVAFAMPYGGDPERLGAPFANKRPD